MNSCIYRAKVMHDRLSPKRHRFSYNVYYFYLDLDEIDTLAQKFSLISRNKWNVFSFRDAEHLQLPIDQPDKAKSTKAHIIDYLQSNNVQHDGGKIMLLTGLNVLGYNFNPVSFYIIYTQTNDISCCIVEVQNTFKEMKPYFLSNECFDGRRFHLNTTKYFYVSPFIAHDTQFDFKIGIPSDDLTIGIDDYKDGERFFITSLTGKRKKITRGSLVYFALRFPFIPLKIITLIHWQALRLFLKNIRFYRKTEFKDLQRDVYRKKN